jgi:SAM-dependent methyltransferase
MDEEQRRQAAYNELHLGHPLRYPLEDYPFFYEWLNVPRGGEGLKLLDVACGQGFFLEAIENSGSALELHGVDFSSVALKLAEKRLVKSQLALDSVYSLPYEDRSFDYCACLGSLEHFDAPERALREMHRVTKANGKIMIILPNQYYVGLIWKVLVYGEGESQGQEGITLLRTIQEWEAIFIQCDLDITGIRGYNGEDHISWYFKRKDGVITEMERIWRSVLDTWVKPLIPLNLSEAFVFTLRRQP